MLLNPVPMKLEDHLCSSSSSSFFTSFFFFSFLFLFIFFGRLKEEYCLLFQRFVNRGKKGVVGGSFTLL